MNIRKFYFIVSIVVSAFLFLSGSVMLSYLNSMNTSNSPEEKNNNFVSDFLKPFVIGKDPVNFLVLVGDKAEANTDTMLLVNFNPSTDKLSILSIPRDTKVNVPGLKIPKVNSLYARKDGERLLVETVSSLLDVNIKYYVYFNISTFRKIIDLLGGVEINVPVNMDYDDPTQNLHIHLKKGKQRLDGKKAEQFLRFRHPNANGYTKEMKKYYDGSDIKRIEAQQYFLKELIRQKANILYLPKLNDIINVVYDNLETNIGINEVTKLAKSITNFSVDNVKMYTLPGSSVMYDDIWYFIYKKSEAESFLKENFSAMGTFAEYNNQKISSDSSKNTNNNTGTQHNDSNKSSTSSKKKIDVTKNNPSNSDTSVKGTAKPTP